MHNLKKLIAEWRKVLSATPNVAEETLDELENHLRETVDQFVRSGLTESEAFERAVQQLGRTSTIAAEFKKLDQPTWLPIKIVIGAGIAAALVFVILSIAFTVGPSSLLLGTHV